MTRQQGCETREDVLRWIIKNQLGRRNLAPEQKSYLHGKFFNLEKHQDAGLFSLRGADTATRNRAAKITARIE
jgi:hypothetical protein